MTEPNEPDHCLNCGGSEKSVHTRGSTCYYVCRDCDWAWGERPTVECSWCKGTGEEVEWVDEQPAVNQCPDCDGAGRIDASHLPLCSVCRRRHGDEVRHACE